MYFFRLSDRNVGNGADKRTSYVIGCTKIAKETERKLKLVMRWKTVQERISDKRELLLLMSRVNGDAVLGSTEQVM